MFTPAELDEKVAQYAAGRIDIDTFDGSANWILPSHRFHTCARRCWL
jgi:hypothetical protein